jgi:peptide-methionine (S)-S-oxide reductase
VNPFVNDQGGERSLIVSGNQIRTTFLVAAALANMLSASSAAAAERLETAILAGGCFWGVEGVYEHVKGVRKVVSGYAGGIRNGLDRMGGGRSGFAEAVRISFDPAQISYDQLLEIFFTVAHDPTQVDRQGPDIGPRYRSAIFPQNAQQRQVAQRFLEQLRASGQYKRPIATRIESGRFEMAEREHQDYMRKNPSARYVVVNDLPKLAELRRAYPQFWRE